ncbi:MAG: hypothetical protein JWP32_793 [Schumannella sp.]|nr:hypothetical protein [Schumannella sp.]
MTRRAPLDPAIHRAPFATRDLEIWGVRESRIRASDIRQPFRGVNVVGHGADTLRDRAEALSHVLRQGDAFSHTTAAALVGAPLPKTDSRIHVTSVGRENRIRRPGVVGHRATAIPRTMLGTLPIVEPAHAWVQLATMLTDDDLVAVGDFLVTPDRHRKTAAIASIDALAAAIAARGRGAARAHRALADVRAGAESRMETLTRLLLLRAGLPEPELNPGVQIQGTTLHPDLLFREWRIVLEYEGDGHRTDPKAWRRDIWRREAFQAAGFRVIQVHAEDVLAEPEAFLARVCHAIAQRRTL